MDSRTPLSPMSWLGSWLVAAALVVLSGCATPDAVRRLEAESVASIEAYHQNVEVALESLLAAYFLASRREIDALAEIEVMEATQHVVIGEGEEAEHLAFLSPGSVESLIADYRDALDRVRLEVQRYRQALDLAEQDYLDALRLRGRIKEWLARGGIEPEDIQALTEALADEIAR